MNLDDERSLLVYADELQHKGDPHGELIALQIAGKDTAELEAKLAPPDPLVEVEWRRGFWRMLRLHNNGDWMDEKYDGLSVAKTAFARPVCALLEELRLGIIRWDFNHKDVPAILAAAGEHPWAARLKKLHLGDTGDDIDMGHQVVGVVGEVITRSFPAIESLTIHSGAQSWRGEGETFGVAGLRLPRLVELTVETCAMSKDRLAALLDAELPSLESLELWFGAADYDADATLADLEPLLAGERFPKLRALGLKNAEFTDELAARLVASPLASRLERLDLSMGTMGSEGARALATGRFPRLARLDVSRNYLTDDDVALLRVASVIADEQKEDDDEQRFVSVHE